MRTVSVRVVGFSCVECRNLLLADCQKFGLPLPIGEVIVVPRDWAKYRCPHSRNGFVLDFRSVPTSSVNVTEETEAGPSRCEDGAEIAPPEWWNNLDASKNIGYPAREEGRYGSFPSHDGFGDESDP